MILCFTLSKEQRNNDQCRDECQFPVKMSSETRNRSSVDWARFGLADQNSASTDVQFASKPSVLDESSYGGQATRDNELFTEEQVSFCVKEIMAGWHHQLYSAFVDRVKSRGGNPSSSYHSLFSLELGMESSLQSWSTYLVSSSSFVQAGLWPRQESVCPSSWFSSQVDSISIFPCVEQPSSMNFSFTVGVILVSVLSAIGICERCKVESGGVYFLLSYVLGSRLAAAVGLLYCFGQVKSFLK